MANYARGRNELKTGLIAALAVIMFIAMFMALTDRGLSRHRSTLHVAMPSADKLKKGDPVLFRGVPVGEVRGLDFAADGGVMVTVRITRQLHLTHGATAALSGSLLGSQSLLIHPGEPLGDLLSSGDTLPGLVAPPLTARLESLSEGAERLIGDSTATLLHGALAGAVSATDEISRLAGTANAVLGDQAAHLTRTTASMAAAAENLSRLTDREHLANTMHNLERASASLASTAARMDSASGALSSVLSKVDRGHGSLGRMVNDQALYERLIVTVGDAGALLRDVKDQPRRYLTVKVF